MSELMFFVDHKDWEDNNPEDLIMTVNALALPDDWTKEQLCNLYRAFREEDDGAWRGDSFLVYLVSKGYGELTSVVEMICSVRFGLEHIYNQEEEQPIAPVVEVSWPPPPPLAGWGPPHQRSDDETDAP